MFQIQWSEQPRSLGSFSHILVYPNLLYGEHVQIKLEWLFQNIFCHEQNLDFNLDLGGNS